MSNRLVRLSNKLYGTPPRSGAPRVDRLRWVRRIGARSTAFYVPVIAAAGIGTRWPTWLCLVLAVGVLSGAANIASLTLKIRREEHATER